MKHIYTATHTLYIKVEATNLREAQRLTAAIAEDVRRLTPKGVKLMHRLALVTKAQGAL